MPKVLVGALFFNVHTCANFYCRFHFFMASPLPSFWEFDSLWERESFFFFYPMRHFSRLFALILFYKEQTMRDRIFASLSVSHAVLPLWYASPVKIQNQYVMLSLSRWNSRVNLGHWSLQVFRNTCSQYWRTWKALIPPWDSTISKPDGLDSHAPEL